MPMRAAHHVGKLCTGHGCFPPRPSATGAKATTIDDTPAHRACDKWHLHCCPAEPEDICHSAITDADYKPPYTPGTCDTTQRCFVEDSPMSYIGTPLTCGSFIMEGSPEVFIDVVCVEPHKILPNCVWYPAWAYKL